MQSSTIHLVPVFLAAVFFGGCSSVQGIRVPVLRPSPVNLTAHENLAVDKFEGNGAPTLAREFALALRQAKNPATGKPGFKVTDYSEVEQLLDRIRGSRGEPDPRSEELLKRWRNVDVMLKGEIADHQVKESMVVVPNVDKKGRKAVYFTRKAKANVELTITALDDKDQTIDRALLRGSATASTKMVNGKPREIDHEALLAAARRQVVRQYLRRVLPRREWIRVQLYKDKGLPDLAIGNGLAQSGDWKAAHDNYARAVEQATGEQAEVRYKALFNLGVALEFTDRFAEARTKLQEAFRLKQARLIRSEMQRLARRERDAKRLREQQAAAPGR